MSVQSSDSSQVSEIATNRYHVFHHDTTAFSVSGHIWVDAINAHVTFQSVKPSHLWTSSESGSHHRHAQRASCYVGLFPSHHDSRFLGSGPI